jgi:hypothetical protein
MDITFLIKSIAGLAVILGILILIFLYTPQKKKKNIQKKRVSSQSPKNRDRDIEKSLEELLAVIKDKHATTEELAKALELIIKYHGKIHPKLGMRSHPDFDIYSEILLRICRHPNTNKDIIVKFDKALAKRNPEYLREINDSLNKGLNSRGF